MVCLVLLIFLTNASELYRAVICKSAHYIWTPVRSPPQKHWQFSTKDSTCNQNKMICARGPGRIDSASDLVEICDPCKLDACKSYHLITSPLLQSRVHKHKKTKVESTKTKKGYDDKKVFFANSLVFFSLLHHCQPCQSGLLNDVETSTLTENPHQKLQNNSRCLNLSFTPLPLLQSH